MLYLLPSWAIILTLARILLANAEQINIGLIYESNNPIMENIFQLAISRAKDINPDLNLHARSAAIEPGNAFESSRKLCKMLKHKLIAVVGPSSTLPAKHTMSLCDVKELPFIDTRWDFGAQLSTINMHPHPSQLAKSLKDVVSALGWSSFTIIYETGEYLSTVSELLQMYGPGEETITVRRYELDLNQDYRNVLRRIKNAEEYSFVVVGSMDTLPEFFKQAQQVGIITGAYRYIIGNLDLQTMDLEPYSHGDANITGFRLISPDNVDVLEVAQQLYAVEEPFLNVSCPITVSMALLYDGIQLLAETFQHIVPQPIELDCHDDSSWENGYTLVNYIKSVNIRQLHADVCWRWPIPQPKPQQHANLH